MFMNIFVTQKKSIDLSDEDNYFCVTKKKVLIHQRMFINF